MPQITAGVSGVLRIIKQAFAGVSGANREIRDGYAGVSGVNRPIFASVVKATLTVGGSDIGGIRKGCFYTTLNGSGSYSNYNMTFSVKFARKLTFTSDRINASLTKKQGSWYYCPHRLTVGNYQGNLSKQSKSSSMSLRIPASQSPLIADTVSFYISNSDVSSNTTSDTEIQITAFKFYPEEYPDGLAVPMDSLVASRPVTTPSQTIELIEL